MSKMREEGNSNREGYDRREEGRREKRMEGREGGREEERKGGWREGEKEGRTEGRKEAEGNSCWPSCASPCLFKGIQAPDRLELGVSTLLRRRLLLLCTEEAPLCVLETQNEKVSLVLVPTILADETSCTSS